MYVYVEVSQEYPTYEFAGVWTLFVLMDPKDGSIKSLYRSRGGIEYPEWAVVAARNYEQTVYSAMHPLTRRLKKQQRGLNHSSKK